jgi:dTDP-4-dehydrorhamnose reductase
MKLLVTGAGGLLGTEVAREGAERGHALVALERAALDVTDADAVRERVGDESPTWVIHCAAYTAVDRAEDEPELAMRVNRDGAAHVARAAAGAGARMAHVSTDYVFDGRTRTPYRNDDEPAPLSVYGATKLAGERAVLDASLAGRRPLVTRTGWMYGAGGRNFVNAMLARARAGEALRVVDDQVGRPSWARNVARGMLELVERGVEGVWHVADGGTATWLELAREALRVEGLEARLDGVSTAEWGAAAARPRWSVLDVTATEQELGRPMEPWRNALRRYLEGRGGGTEQDAPLQPGRPSK